MAVNSFGSEAVQLPGGTSQDLELSVVVAGESAGANPALAVLLRRSAENHPALLAGALYSGVYDLREERFAEGSWVDHADSGLLLPEELGRAMREDYVGGHPADDPLVSPLVADLRRLPPLFLQVSDIP